MKALLAALALFPWSFAVVGVMAAVRVLKKQPKNPPTFRVYRNLGTIENAPRGAQLLEGVHVVRQLHLVGYKADPRWKLRWSGR